MLVVGCGNYGMEVCLDACDHGARPSMVVRDAVHVRSSPVREKLGKSAFELTVLLGTALGEARGAGPDLLQRNALGEVAEDWRRVRTRQGPSMVLATDHSNSHRMSSMASSKLSGLAEHLHLSE